jgi:Ca-activated chloride channel family protein
MKKYSVLILLICILNTLINAQGVESKIALKKGNETYKNGSYDTSLSNYESSFLNDTSNFKAIYNKGNASFMKGDFDDARKNYNHYLNSSKDNIDKANAHFNIGNSYLTQYNKQVKEQSEQPNSEFLQNAIEQYKSSLRYNSDDNDARHNLSYAMRLIQQNKDQQNKDQQNKDQQNKDQQNKDQQNKDQQNKDQQNKDQQNKDQQNKDQQNKDQQNKDQQKVEKNQAKQQAMKNLDAVNSDEEKILLKVNRKKGDQKKKSKTKDW